MWLLTNLNTEIKECQDLVRESNTREVRFDSDQTDYSNLGQMIKTFEPLFCCQSLEAAGDWP